MREFSTTSSHPGDAIPLPTTRPAAAAPSFRATSAMPSLMKKRHGFPTDSSLSNDSGIGTKRKERNMDDTTSASTNRDTGDETKIDVFVRCRGRNEQEVRQNSGVAVNLDKVKGTTVDLPVGSNSLGNKTYAFDGVFSPTADQQIIFDEVVKSVLDEVLKGFNCTIFVYGQTGTGKTYTMSGDISDHTLLPDDAGIIPRVLHFLFLSLNSQPSSPTKGTSPENSVKVSFIELYNEELRDLLSADDKSNLKIFDGDSRRGAATVVQGMEERYIAGAKKGIQLLRDGSDKRQVAATKCNDLSSRSHTVFTVTVYNKRLLASGEEYLSSGKLNLVDLAGSENIGRSGAENKRAVEAGLINKSLLTLGRVINALVDQSTHIPYRESKLTRLLQDSLGGRTKTCIIATISPARSNLEETISTLDYAFRAKNIKNKPQVNRLMPKNVLLKDLTFEIERLKSELTATRQRNGVYLSNEAYEELVNDSESHKILVKEQREKIETVECKLARKGQDLLDLTSNFDNLKRDSDAAHGVLANTKSLLEETQAAFTQTKRMLEEETSVRQQHERTEQQLISTNRELSTTLGLSSTDVTGLHLKLQRQSELHEKNRARYFGTQQALVNTTKLVENRLADFQTTQKALTETLSGRLDTFVTLELEELNKARTDLEKTVIAFEQSHGDVLAQTTDGKNKLNKMLGDVKTHREDLEKKFGTGLNALDVAARRISEGISTEIDAFYTQLHLSHSTLGLDLRETFDYVSNDINMHREELQRLRSEMTEANQRLEQSQSRSIDTLSHFVEAETTVRDQENKDLMQLIQTLFEANVLQQERRIGAIAQIIAQLKSAGHSHSAASASFRDGSEQLTERSKNLNDRLDESRDIMETQIESNSVITNKHTEHLKLLVSSAQDKAVRAGEEQALFLDAEMGALDTKVDQILKQNSTIHAIQEKSLSALSAKVQDSYGKLGDAFIASFNRVDGHRSDVAERADRLRENLPHLDRDAHICTQLVGLRQRVEHDNFEEYIHTGQTPTRREYIYPAVVSRRSDLDTLQESLRKAFTEDERLSASRPKSPSKALIYTDDDGSTRQPIEKDGMGISGTASSVTSLRELDVNVMQNTTTVSINPSIKGIAMSAKDSACSNTLAPQPSLKRPASASAESRVASKKRGLRSTVMASHLMNNRGVLPGRENMLMPDPNESVDHGTVSSFRRRLRSHDRNTRAEL